MNDDRGLVLATSADQGWPPEALAEPPRYPFCCDRFSYDAPGMDAWRTWARERAAALR